MPYITFIPIPTGDCHSLECRLKATVVVKYGDKYVSYCSLHA